MPAKKTNGKRKVDASTPIVSDPFSAAKKSKNNEKNKEDEDSTSDDIKECKNLPVSPKQSQLTEIKYESKLTKKIEKTKKDTNDSDEEEEKIKTSPRQSKLTQLKHQTKVIQKGKKTKKGAGDDTDSKEEPEEGETKTTQTFNKEEFKTPNNGKEWNFKITTWNVNGIRAWIEHGGLDYLKAEDPDIFVLQETKCDKSKIPPKAELKGYHCYWLSGDTQGYSGVGLMSKIKPIKVTYGINDKDHNSEGRIIVAEYEKFHLINSYIPNSGRGLVRLSYRMEWEKQFRKFLADLEKIKPVILCGDLNVAHKEIDLKNPESNKKTAGFTKEERECFTNLLSDGYIDSFRYLYPNVTGAYTYFSYFRASREKNVGWRLDYFVLSDKLKENLVDNNIRSKVTGSDHTPVVLYLNI